MAISEKETADWSVFTVGGVDENGYLQIKDVIRDRMDGLMIADTLLALQKIYDPVAVGIEEGQISKSIGPFLNKAMIEQNTYLSLIPMKHSGKDKISRARSIQARMRAGGVKFDKSADWYQMLEDECMTFPRAKHDDQVDSLSYMGLLIDKMIEAPTVEEEEEEEYQRELEDTGFYESGRNETTGY